MRTQGDILSDSLAWQNNFIQVSSIRSLSKLFLKCSDACNIFFLYIRLLVYFS